MAPSGEMCNPAHNALGATSSAAILGRGAVETTAKHECFPINWGSFPLISNHTFVAEDMEDPIMCRYG